MDAIIATATSTFLTTTGFSLDAVVTWAGTLVKLVIGTGLAVLQALLPWILALIVISAIVYFLYRALRFFRH